MERTKVPAYSDSGKLLAAGEAAYFKHAVVESTGPVDGAGAPLLPPKVRPKRRCARCRRRFKPTAARWVLCLSCFKCDSAMVE